MKNPEYGTEDYRRWAVLFNDITHAPTEEHLLFSTRYQLAEWLWAQGWRRDVRPEDITEGRLNPPAEEENPPVAPAPGINGHPSEEEL